MELSLSKIFTGILALIVGIALMGSFYIIPSGSVAVEDAFGKYKDSAETAGLNWKMPFVEDYTRLDTKIQTVNYHGKSDVEDSDGIINTAALDVPDSKNVPFDIELTITFYADGNKAPYILTTYGANYFEKVINPRVRDVVRDVGGQYSVESIANHRDEINTQINKRLAEEFKELPFIFDRSNLRAIVLPGKIQEAILGVQAAKQEEQRLIIVTQQEQQKKAAIETQAQAAAAKATIEADGNAKAILMTATAQAKANNLLAQSITPLLVQREKIAKWNGTVPTMVGGDEGASFLVDLRAKGGE